MKNDINIRMATVEDAKGILDIYKYYIVNTPITFEYGVPTISEFETRITNTIKKYPYLVALDGERILGYAYVSEFKSRMAYSWAVETSIYVDKDEKGNGIGGKLYNKLEKVLIKQNIINVNACITYPNPDSISFHEKMGYKNAAHFHKCGFKLGKWHDMVWMEKMLGEHDIPPADFISIQNLKL